jgi:DHA2 family multidrug resistance protein-like MFS transporter
VRYTSPPNLIAIGFVVAAFGFRMLTQTGTAYDLPVIATAYAVFSVGLAPVFTLASDLIVSRAPSERAGTAAGISEMSAELGGALGIALLGSLVTAIYRGAVGDAIIGDLPATTDAARDTLGAALSVAEALGDQPGEDLASASRSAFVAAFQAAALVSTGIALIAAAATAFGLGRSLPTAQAAASKTDV